MEIYKPIRGIASMYAIFLALLFNAFIVILLKLVDSYVVYNVLKIGLILVDVYYLYYLLMDFSVKYMVYEDNITISYFWGLKSTKIFYNDIMGYEISEKNIHSIKLSGIGSDKFAYGRNIIDKIGTTYMYVSSNKAVLFLKTEKMCYGISPENLDKIIDILKQKNIDNNIKEYVPNKNVELYKDKKFFVTLVLVSILIIILTLNPFILYLRNAMPQQMPLTFNARFIPTDFGTSKEFAFKQMTYGVFNMIILFCMYYAAYFSAKYDKKSAYKYLYVSLFVVLIFMFLQLRILFKFA
ncbi:PH domain-containing protein [Clostridium sp. 19966]|uniref:PH domain-containing protein n=1 Tax=Clostridium sp. 19966 TaxID=2768166 RepID=UPI0028DF8093|nr:PH domain-containing protein [Clostridium sp. 19966]MDT8715331.1 PH domain-containing protein [Clostridium sp. 19966]